MKLSPSSTRRAAFTMIEVAICLAIIGIALVGIIGVLPRGMNTQRDNREQTIIGQDANQLLEIIRNGARAQDDLTNYIYAVTNYWVLYNAAGNIVSSGSNGYTYYAANLSGSAPSPNPFATLAPLNTGSNIVSVLSTPEYIGINTGTPNYNFGLPIPNLFEGGISNHVVAYVRSLSGLAAEKPPQDNNIMQQDSFTYRVLCVNAPLPMDSQVWQPTVTYSQGQQVYLYGRNWIATNSPNMGDAPWGNGATSGYWVRNYFRDQMSSGQREIRLRFIWPELPNGNVGNNYQNVRVTVGGQLAAINNAGLFQYYYEPQSYVVVP